MSGGVEVTGATVEAADPKVSEMPEGKWHTGCWVHRAEIPGVLWATDSYVAVVHHDLYSYRKDKKRPRERIQIQKAEDPGPSPEEPNF